MFDYNTHEDFGSGDRICYHGVMDFFPEEAIEAEPVPEEGEAAPADGAAA